MIYGPLLFNILFPIGSAFLVWEWDQISAILPRVLGSFIQGCSLVTSCMSLCTVLLLSHSGKSVNTCDLLLC
jgi:hypothetical protein